MRSLVIVPGDQLDAQSSALQDFDPVQDAVWMAEVAQESTHVWSAKQRIHRFSPAHRRPTGPDVWLSRCLVDTEGRADLPGRLPVI